MSRKPTRKRPAMTAKRRQPKKPTGRTTKPVAKKTAEKHEPYEVSDPTSLVIKTIID